MYATLVMANKVGAPAYQPPSGEPMYWIDDNTIKPMSMTITRGYNSPLERTLTESGYIVRILAKYGISDQYDRFMSTIRCESNFYHEGVFGSHGEYGIAQFKRQTFYYYCPTGDWYDPYSQIGCMSYMWSIGLNFHWTCYK